jgi:radial spoke head protein 4A
MLGVSKTLGVLHKEDSGGSLYAHLCEVLGRLHEAEDPLASFELLSKYVRDVANPPVKGADLTVAETASQASARSAWIAKLGSLSAQTEVSLGDVKDFWTESRMMRIAGLGFSDYESYALSLSIRKLATETKGVTSSRFWGKILGIKNDYFIAELELTGKDAAAKTNPLAELSDYLPGLEEYVEPRGVGVNKYVYFCTTSVNGEWVMLPNAVPSQIKASREINKLFTGELSTPIWSHPPFPWTEKELLRSMIARITHSTCLAPTGYYEEKVDENAEEGAPAEIARAAWEGFGATAPNTPGLWAHARPYLRDNGRCSFATPPEEGEEGVSPETKAAIDKLTADKEADANEAGGGEPEKPFYFQTLDAEIDFCKGKFDDLGKALPENPKWKAKLKDPWLLVVKDDAPTFKVFGDTSTYNFADIPKSYAVTVVESLRFPGAYTVAQGDNFANIYVGYGVKKQRAFLPLIEMAPSTIMDEPKDHPELIKDDDQEMVDDAVDDDDADADGNDGG